MDEALCLDRAADRKRTVRVPRGVKRRCLGHLRGYAVWLVNGEGVRNEVHADFTCGGSDARYAYCERMTIWIDDVLGPLDGTATLLHEYVECELMKRKKMTYEDAHDIATQQEAAFREALIQNRPKRIDLKRVEAALG